MKKEISRTIRLDEAADMHAQATCAEVDCSFSQLIRFSLILAVPLIKACPSLLHRVTLDDFKDTQ